MERLALMFSGQGSQCVGMADKICRRYQVADEVFKEASNVLSIDLKKLANESQEEITLTYNAQPLILTTSMAMYKAFCEEFEVKPSIMTGHSLGEISALAAAGAITLQDAVKIARKRGRIMQQVVADIDGAMLAVSTRDVSEIIEMCANVDPAFGTVEVANFNSKVQTVVSGAKAAVMELEERLSEKEIKATLLNVSAPFHSSYMKLAAELMREELKKYTFATPSTPVFSSTALVQYGTAQDVVDILSEQLYSPVNWVKTMKYIYSQNVTYGIEIGPGKVLKNLMKTNVSNIPVYAFDLESDVAKAKEHVEKSYVPFLTRSLGIVVATKNNNFNDDEYKAGVIEPYNKISALAEIVENEGRKATRQEMDEAVQMLLSVFATKHTPVEEQKRRFDDLFIETGTLNEFSDFKI